ncbi:MAG: NAD(P)-dependent glycerol-3-phosphate dehydrogenase [Candidatus Marinimicrobia bacterium]|nr:NAD(P)-dependent glycerol-3-phosphate dehydrogenase [Candidatus Neomarinimicrobiota bacterium]
MIARFGKKEKIAVLGAGSWGTTVAIHLHKIGHKVKLWEYYKENVDLMKKTCKTPLLPGIPISPEILISNDIHEVIAEASVICIVVPSHTVRGLLRRLKGKINDQVIFVNLTKGIEENTLMRMSEVIHDVLEISKNRIVALYGPSHAEEVSREMPTTIVAASSDLETASHVQKIFMNKYLRVYTNNDIIGVEVGGSIKNVIAIASGICDGLGLGDNTKAALITRGLMEITRMGMILGAREETFAGLSGVGDLIVTCSSKHSRNRYVGEEIGKGRKLQEVLDGMSMIAEGVHTANTVHQLVEKYHAVMPISEEIYTVLFKGKDPKKALIDLMTRNPVTERHSLPES